MSDDANPVNGDDAPRQAKSNTSLVLLVIATVVLATMFSFFGIWLVPSLELGSEQLNVSFLVFLLLLSYLVFSYRFWDPIAEDERGALLLFGKPIVNLDSGAFYAPLFIFTVRKVDRKVIQREFPAEPENIYRGDMKLPGPLPEGKKPPIRVAFSEKITEDTARTLFDDFEVQSPEGIPVKFIAEVPDDGLSRRVTAEPSITVRVRIDDPISFLQNIGSIDEMARQIEDEVTSVVVNHFSRMSVSQALQNLRWMGYILFHAVERRTGLRGSAVESWGIQIQGVTVKLIHLDHGINSSISDAAQAPFNREATVTKAEGERRRLILEGEGAAEAARLLQQETLTGRAAGLAELAGKIGVSGETAQAAEVARTLASDGNTIVVGPEGLGQLAGMAAAVVKKSKKSDDSGEADAEPETSENEGDGQ